MSKKIKLAITGTIGSGKTTVSSYLREKGFYVFDCDEYNAVLLNKEDVIRRINIHFPNCVNNGMLDKKILAYQIFNDATKKECLESILHPLIIEKMENEALKHDVFFAEVPLLFECGLETMFDHNLLIVTDKDIAIKRLINRGLNEDEANIRINNQMNLENKISRAEEIIYNNGNLDDLFNQVDKWINRYVR